MSDQQTTYPATQRTHKTPSVISTRDRVMQRPHLRLGLELRLGLVPRLLRHAQLVLQGADILKEAYLCMWASHVYTYAFG